MNRHQTKYRNTARKMNDALLSLLETKDFASITIKEVCEEAGVNRSTFYSHYENMAELLDDTRRHITTLFPEYVLKPGSYSTPDEMVESVLQDDFIIPILDTFEEKRSVFMIPHFYPDPYDYPPEYNRLLQELTVPYYEARGIRDRRTMEYMFQYLYSGTHAIIYKWLRDGCKESKSEICRLIRTCMNQSVLMSDRMAVQVQSDAKVK